jgi:hypothetical protein
MYIGQDHVTYPHDFASAPTQVLKGGEGGFVIGYGAGYDYTDPISISINEANDYEIAYHFPTDTLWRNGYLDGSVEHAAYYVSATDQSDDQDIHTGGLYAADVDINLIAAMEKNNYPNTWQVALDLEAAPDTVTEDSSPLTKHDTIAEVEADNGSWCWISDVLYVQPSSGVPGSYTYTWELESASGGNFLGFFF